MNSLLTSARADEKAGKYDTAIASMQQATQLGPDQPILWLELGYAQAGGGKCDEAVTSLQKSIDLNTASKKPNPVLNGPAYDKLGECNGKLKKFPEAQAAYDKAAQADPAKAGNYYYNEAVVLYNGGSHDLAAAAADKAITADPNNANAYYLKGQSLIDKASVDPKTQKMSAPDGCLEAYLKYLELAPTGPHAADVTGIVGAFDQKQVDSFKQNRGKKK
jgi:tetratricopeptide (TPR) repeat protein